MLVKKLSKLHAGSTQIDKMSEALCINQFIVLNLYVYQKRKKKILKVFLFDIMTLD